MNHVLRTMLVLSLVKDEGSCTHMPVWRSFDRLAPWDFIKPAFRLQLSGGAPNEQELQISLTPAQSKSIVTKIPSELVPSLDSVLARHANGYFPEETISGLQMKVQKKNLTMDEGYVWNLLKMKMKMKHGSSRKKSRQSHADCPINRTLVSVRAELEYLHDQIAIEDDAKKTAVSDEML